MKWNARLVILMIVLTVIILGIYGVRSLRRQPDDHRPLNELMALTAQDVSRVVISIFDDNSREYKVYRRNGQTRIYFVPTETSETVRQRIEKARIPIRIAHATFWQRNSPWILTYVPMILTLLLLVYINKAGKVGRKFRDDGRCPSVTFQNVGGNDGVKEELKEVVEHLKNPQCLKEIGGVPPRGILLAGPPGVGKTLLARAVAGEAGVPFFSVSGSDFVEQYVGVGASRVRELFIRARLSAPCIVFIDEVDAVGHQRGGSSGDGQGERDQTLNQLLVEMDGFERGNDVVVMAATNRPDKLDSALCRPGRFDRTIEMALPDIRGRKHILETTAVARKTRLDPNVDLNQIAHGTPGFSGADLANLMNEAAISAVRDCRAVVEMRDFDAARDRLVMGLQTARLMSDKERRIIAVHETGHALVAFYLPESDPIHKVTIVSRGQALGMMVRMPDTDRYMVSRSRLITDMAVALGGRLAEERYGQPGDVTTGAEDDLIKVTEIATNMVRKWGLSVHEKQTYRVFFDEISLTEAQASALDAEIVLIIDEARKQAIGILDAHGDDHRRLWLTLLERETLTLDEIRSLLAH